MHALAGIVDQDVDAAIVLIGIRHHLAHGGFVTHVGGDGVGQRGGESCQLVRRTRGQRHPRALLREQPRRRQSDAPVMSATLPAISMLCLLNRVMLLTMLSQRWLSRIIAAGICVLLLLTAV